MPILKFLQLQLLLLLQEPKVHFYSLRDPEPERGLAWFILNAFLLIGVALSVTVGLGLVFGAFRTWLLEKYPENRFNGNADDLRLHLDARAETTRSPLSD